MKRIIPSLLITAVFLTLFAVPSFAGVLTFEAINHPIKKKAFFVGGQKKFQFGDDVIIEFDTDTGEAILKGSAYHIKSGEKWSVTSTWKEIGQKGNFTASTVPYENMFDDLLANGKGKITYDDVLFNITTDIVNPVYDGPTDWMGKGKDHLVIKRRLKKGQHVLIVDGWLASLSSSHKTDWSFAIGAGIDPEDPDNPNPVPEPTTMALLGTGLAAAYMKRRKRS